MRLDVYRLQSYTPACYEEKGRANDVTDGVNDVLCFLWKARDYDINSYMRPQDGRIAERQSYDNNKQQFSKLIGTTYRFVKARAPDYVSQSKKCHQHEDGECYGIGASASPADVVGSYESALSATGWNIESSGGGGDPFGLFGGGAGLTATNGDRYLTFNAGGPPGSTFINACIWPAKPGDTNCSQNNNNQGTLGAGGDLLAGIPEPAGANFQAQNPV